MAAIATMTTIVIVLRCVAGDTGIVIRPHRPAAAEPTTSEPSCSYLGQLIQPPCDALVMRARPTPTSTEAVRPIPALRRRPGRRAVTWRARRRGHPLAARVPVSRSSALRRSGRRRAQVLLEHVSGQTTARNAAPALGARVEAHHDTGIEPPERLRARERLGPHGNDRRGVGEGVSAALRFLSESRCRAERDG